MILFSSIEIFTIMRIKVRIAVLAHMRGHIHRAKDEVERDKENCAGGLLNISYLFINRGSVLLLAKFNEIND